MVCPALTPALSTAAEAVIILKTEAAGKEALKVKFVFKDGFRS